MSWKAKCTIWFAREEKSSDVIDYQAHNLWLIDERLPFYSFFNSDKTIGQQTSDGEGGKKPDITFFDIALSFQQKKEPVPIIIVEFKRPGRDNYTAAENPIINVWIMFAKSKWVGRLLIQWGST